MSLADEIGKLQSLRDSGAVTEEEFRRAKELVLGGGPAPGVARAAWTAPERPWPGAETLNRMARSTNDRWLGGVCGGLARTTPLPAWVWRLLFTLSAVVYGIGVIPYVLLWIFMPSEETLNKPAPYPTDDLV